LHGHPSRLRPHRRHASGDDCRGAPPACPAARDDDGGDARADDGRARHDGTGVTRVADAGLRRPAAAFLRAGGRLGSFGALGIGLVIGFAVEILFFTIKSPYFFDGANFANIGRAIAIIGVAAVGETIVIISGGFDLSVGSTMAAAGMISGYLVNHGTAIPAAFAVALVPGLAIGIANGAIVSYGRINPLIATLAMLSIVRGLGFVLTGGADLVISNGTFLGLGTNAV